MSGSESDEHVSKKRKRNPDKHKRNIIRSSKVKGVEHTNWKGDLVQKRVTGERCKCRLKCFSLFDEDDQVNILSRFNNLSSKDEQDILLQSLIEKHDKKAHRPRQDNPKSRQCSFKYFVLKQGSKINVCKQAYISLHGISAGRVRRLCDLLFQGCLPKDKRGMNEKANVIKPEICKAIHEHILSFPVKNTHYGGKQIKYLDSRLNVKTMHELYIKKHPTLFVKYEFFLKYFKENFNFRFGRPQVDTCITCEELGVKIKSPSLSEPAKRAAVAEKIVHSRRAKKFYTKIKEVQELCRTNENIVGISFDYMQNLPLPHLPVQDIFYLRQLWVYCFGIHNMKTQKSKFYMYHEGEGKKGVNEVCSMLHKYITSSIPESVDTLYLISDGCPGQNKNHTILRFALALVNSGRFKEVTHFFPVRGHSYLPNDRNFGVIKRKLKKCDRIYVPQEYSSIIGNASSNFEVENLKTEDILEFKKWWPSFYKRTCLSNESYGKSVPKERKRSLAPSECMSFTYKTNGTIITKQFIDGLQSHTYDVRKNKSLNNVINLPNCVAYPENKVPLNRKKVEDIKKMFPYIIPEHQHFYDIVNSWPLTEEGDEEVE